MTDKSMRVLSKKGRAFRGLVQAVEHPLNVKTQQVTVTVPVTVLGTVAKIAKRLDTNRSAVMVMLIEAVLAEMAAEASEGVQKILGGAAQVSEGSGRGHSGKPT